MNVRQKPRMLIVISMALLTILNISCTNEDDYENRSLINYSKKSLTMSECFFSVPYNNQLSVSEMHGVVLPLNYYSLPEIYHWNHTVSVKGKSNITINTSR